MKLTLDKQALELLFDNDPEMKLEFKNAAVNYASKHFLKEVKYMNKNEPYGFFFLRYLLQNLQYFI